MTITAQKMKFAVVNTFNDSSRYYGTIESTHKTMEAAERANERLQRAVKRANGRDSYLPTVIVGLRDTDLGTGDRLRRGYEASGDLNYPQDRPAEDEATIID